MRHYVNKPMEEMAAELCAGLVRLRKGYVDAAEALLEIIEPSRQYPQEFILFKLTGFRPGRTTGPSAAMDGASLRRDLLTLMLDICDSFVLRGKDYDQAVMDTAALAARMRVSTKTVQRWRKAGLPARRLLGDDGRRRTMFLQSSVDRFVRRSDAQVRRAAGFSQLTAAQRADLVSRAARMTRLAGCSLNDVARSLARRTGRAVETVRYTIRRHDMLHPASAVFPHLTAPLRDDEKQAVYRRYVRGVSPTALARQYHRTRGSIYRIVNQTRARQLLARRISYIHNAQFDAPEADERILAVEPPAAPVQSKAAQAGAALAPSGMDMAAPLTAAQEADLFCRYNYLKYKADCLRRQIDIYHVRVRQLEAVESLLLRASAIKDQLVRCNMRLAASIAQRHVRAGPKTLTELISDASIVLMQAVEKFDFARGYRFSTYASWAIMRSFARSVPREQQLMDRFSTGREELLEIVASIKPARQAGSLSELHDALQDMLGRLAPRERMILMHHYGLDESSQPRTLEQLGKQLGVTRQRVRQIEAQAISKLRRMIGRSGQDLLG